MQELQFSVYMRVYMVPFFISNACHSSYGWYAALIYMRDNTNSEVSSHSLTTFRHYPDPPFIRYRRVSVFVRTKCTPTYHSINSSF